MKLFQSLMFAGGILGSILLVSLLVKGGQKAEAQPQQVPAAQPQQFVLPPQPVQADRHSLFIMRGNVSTAGASMFFYREDLIGHPSGSWNINYAGQWARIPFDPNAVDPLHLNGQLLIDVPQAFIDNFLTANPDPTAYATTHGY